MANSPKISVRIEERLLRRIRQTAKRQGLVHLDGQPNVSAVVNDIIRRWFKEKREQRG